MSEHVALYRKWRPMTFDDVVGQEHITKTLKNEVSTGKTGHAFLFCGGRGTGKTSSARILSRALNCENQKDGNPCNECEKCRGILSGEILDIIEIDAASNNGVENIRSLRDEARFCAANTKYKVYIIDEVHMLSTGAFNALLKLLEEPPEGVIFILATTETHKVPLTILSRCQRFDFKRITSNDIYLRLMHVAEIEGIDIDKDSCRLIARAADGALRDALGFLEQCASSSPTIRQRDVYNLLGLTEKTFLYRIVHAAASNDVALTISLADEYINTGKSAAKFIESLTSYFTDLLKCSISPEVFSDNTDEETEELMLASGEMSRERLMYSIDVLTRASASLKYMTGDRVMLDIALIKMCNPTYTDDKDALIMRIAELERKIALGVSVKAERTESIIPVSEAKHDEKEEKKPKINLAEVHKPTSEEFKLIENKWSEICRDTDNLKLLIALERSKIKEDSGALVLLFDDKDKIMTDILSQPGVMELLTSLISKHAGFVPKILLRLASYYEHGDFTVKNDPINLINFDETKAASPEASLHEEEEEDEDDEEYSFEED